MHEAVPQQARVEAAMARVRRRDFLKGPELRSVEHDAPIPIGFGQTTSQPSLIAQIVSLLELRPGARVLEVGTGCGYQTAVIAQLGCEVFSVEIIPELAERATEALRSAGFHVTSTLGGTSAIHLCEGDGSLGWPEAGPFDGIVVAAGAKHIPPALLDQLALGGRLIMPVGQPDSMHLVIVERDAHGVLHEQRSLPVRFVPLTGRGADASRA
jgi:protein-L-isoaspartate(D-aspartate) O-methyltransferase